MLVVISCGSPSQVASRVTAVTEIPGSNPGVPGKRKNPFRHAQGARTEPVVTPDEIRLAVDDQLVSRPVEG